MACFPCDVEPGHRAGELLVCMTKTRSFDANAVQLHLERGTAQKTTAKAKRNITPLTSTKLHVVDGSEWNEGECGKCGGRTPYCKRCSASWFEGCESQLCPAAEESQEV